MESVGRVLGGPPSSDVVGAIAEEAVSGSDGTLLYVRRRGSTTRGFTSILCDGIACDGFIWKYLWDELATHGPVAHWHYRGHGRSQVPRDPQRLDIVDHVADLQRVRAAIGDPPVVLFGHSMGCQVVLESMRAHARGVRGLVLLCGASGRVTHTFKGSDALAQVLPRLIDLVQRHPHLTRALWGGVPPELALKTAFALGEVDPKRMSPTDFMPYLEHMVDMDPAMFFKMLRFAGEHSAEDVLATIDVPVLVVASDRDTFTPPKLAEAMANAMPKGELLMLSGTHAMPLEQREAVGERVDAFMKGLNAEPAAPELASVTPA